MGELFDSGSRAVAVYILVACEGNVDRKQWEEEGESCDRGQHAQQRAFEVC